MQNTLHPGSGKLVIPAENCFLKFPLLAEMGEETMKKNQEQQKYLINDIARISTKQFNDRTVAKNQLQ